jgi:hypothetical protein
VDLASLFSFFIGIVNNSQQAQNEKAETAPKNIRYPADTSCHNAMVKASIIPTLKPIATSLNFAKG